MAATTDIVFTAADTYEVRDGAGTVLDSGSYDAGNGGSITFRGAQVAFSGTPDAGDTFALGASAKQDVFTTLGNIINTLRQPNGGGADMQNNINTQFANLDQAIDNISRTRGMVGARMNALDQQRGLNDDLTLQYKSALSDVQDLNYYDAISQLGAQTTALQAAQQTFTRDPGFKIVRLFALTRLKFRCCGSKQITRRMHSLVNPAGLSEPTTVGTPPRFGEFPWS